MRKITNKVVKNTTNKQEQNKKRKILLATLIPVGILTVAAAVATPTVICLRNKNQVTLDASDCPSDLNVEKDLKLDTKSTIIITVPTGKYIDENKLIIKVGGQPIISGQDFNILYSEDGKIKIEIEASAMKAKNVELHVKYTEDKVLVTKITINDGKQTTLKVGDSTALSYVVEPTNATDKTVTWSSSDESKVTVDSKTGKISANAVTDEGKPVIITAKANDGSEVKGTCKITVTAAEMTKAEWLKAYKPFSDEFVKSTTEYTADNITITGTYKGVKDPNVTSVSYGTSEGEGSKYAEINIEPDEDTTTVAGYAYNAEVIGETFLKYAEKTFDIKYFANETSATLKMYTKGTETLAKELVFNNKGYVTKMVEVGETEVESYDITLSYTEPEAKKVNIAKAEISKDLPSGFNFEGYPESISQTDTKADVEIATNDSTYTGKVNATIYKDSVALHSWQFENETWKAQNIYSVNIAENFPWGSVKSGDKLILKIEPVVETKSATVETSGAIGYYSWSFIDTKESITSNDKTLSGKIQFEENPLSPTYSGKVQVTLYKKDWTTKIDSQVLDISTWTVGDSAEFSLNLDWTKIDDKEKLYLKVEAEYKEVTWTWESTNVINGFTFDLTPDKSIFNSWDDPTPYITLKLIEKPVEKIAYGCPLKLTVYKQDGVTEVFSTITDIQYWEIKTQLNLGLELDWSKIDNREELILKVEADEDSEKNAALDNQEIESSLAENDFHFGDYTPDIKRSTDPKVIIPVATDVEGYIGKVKVYLTKNGGTIVSDIVESSTSAWKPGQYEDIILEIDWDNIPSDDDITLHLDPVE